jgi:hypothetical protein
VVNKLEMVIPNKRINFVKVAGKFDYRMLMKNYISDVLVKYLYGRKNIKRTSTLWNTFGDILIDNLLLNLDCTKQCECCGKRIETKSNRIKYCENCWKEKQKNWQRESMKKKRNNIKCEVLEKCPQP